MSGSPINRVRRRGRQVGAAQRSRSERAGAKPPAPAPALGGTQMVTKSDIGRPVTWYDFSERVTRSGTLKGMSADGREAYVLVNRSPRSLRAKAPPPKLESKDADQLRVAEL